MKLFTIGYSGYEREGFASELLMRGVDLLIDVRSLPASRFYPEYDRAAIEKYLIGKGIQYRHMPEEFGARQDDPRYLCRDGYVDFELFAKSQAFGRGVDFVCKEAQQGKVCVLMCAEKDAANCHRSILIARRFHEMGWAVAHLSPGREETHEAFEKRLLDLYFPDRFQLSLLEEPREESEYLEEAYRLQNRKIGFRKDE